MIVILDFGSQYSELIARRVRETNVYSVVLPHDTSYEEIKSHHPNGVIMSGGPSSIYDENAPECDPELLKGDIPILGICYGMQMIVKSLGGEVKMSKKGQEYGKANLLIDDNFDLFEGLWLEMAVWMSHGDSVVELPKGFKRLGHTETCPIAAIGDRDKKIYGLQFHPEVIHTPMGGTILHNFVIGLCQAKTDWTAGSFVDKTIQEIKDKVGDQNVLCALSGGVDSSVVAGLLNKAIGKNLTCMFIDQGFMRKNEAKRIQRLFEGKFNVNLLYIDARDRFFEKIKGVTDPEEKRKKIGEEFIRVFEEESKKLEGSFPFLAQGTLYPDVIESAAIGVANTAVTIKTHHNVGGLPEELDFEIIEPLRMLFKDEARKVGLEIGLPEEIVFRHPFPGPGLAIRILGEVTRDRVAVLQEADAIVIEEIKKAKLYRKVWQAFAVLLPVKSVGVMGDKRTYQNTVAIRVVTSTDAMTANWARLPYDVIERISSRIMNEVEGINRVVYDVSSKPPSTIEWE